jgi:hypothetical protein
MWILIGWFGFIGFMVFFLGTYFLFPIDNRAKFFGFLTRRPLGILNIVGKGKEIRKHIISFANDFIVKENKMFVLVPKYIYREGGVRSIYVNELDALDPITLVGNTPTPEELNELPKDFQKLYALQGKLHTKPVSFEKEASKDHAKNPELINSIFLKMKALAEASGLLDVKKLTLLLIIAIGVGLLSAGVGYFVYSKIKNEVIPPLNQMKADIQQIKSSTTSNIPIVK